MCRTFKASATSESIGILASPATATPSVFKIAAAVVKRTRQGPGTAAASRTCRQRMQLLAMQWVSCCLSCCNTLISISGPLTVQDFSGARLANQPLRFTWATMLEVSESVSTFHQSLLLAAGTPLRPSDVNKSPCISVNLSIRSVPEHACNTCRAHLRRHPRKPKALDSGWDGFPGQCSFVQTTIARRGKVLDISAATPAGHHTRKLPPSHRKRIPAGGHAMKPCLCKDLLSSASSCRHPRIRQAHQHGLQLIESHA